MNLNRRNFLYRGGQIGLGFLGLYTFACTRNSRTSETTGNSLAAEGYGPLLEDPEGIFNLPKGFSYKIISRQGAVMQDGFFVPGKPDGMAAFNGGADRTILIRNHENSPQNMEDGPFGKNNELLSKIDKNKLYDFGRGKLPGTGGTTTLVYNHATKSVEKEFLSLGGTIRNCAGGMTPWNSWITCEETIEKANNDFEKDHGYVFEVPADHEGLTQAIPLKAMGRFNHEAVAVDARTGIVYLTEDDGEGLIYRFIPDVPGHLQKGGKLQALAIRDQVSFDTRNWGESTVSFEQKKEYPVRWIDLDDIDSPNNDLRHRGYKNGAARFARGEGMWAGKNEIYFACTNGGLNKTGQVFKYKPGANEGTERDQESPGTLELFAEPNDSSILKHCDNLTIAPWGDVILCEDEDHPFLVGITPDGKYYKLGENTGYDSELTGAVFSPDGSTLFVNIQHAGLTLAIEGPWKKA